MFSELLKRLRSQKGVTQPQLAEAIGVSKGNVGDWETGKSKPGYQAIVALARYFDVSADYLLELNQTPDPNTTVSTPNEKEEEALLSVYRKLDMRDKDELYKIAKLKEENSKQ